MQATWVNTLQKEYPYSKGREKDERALHLKGFSRFFELIEKALILMIHPGLINDAIAMGFELDFSKRPRHVLICNLQYLDRQTEGFKYVATPVNSFICEATNSDDNSDDNDNNKVNDSDDDDDDDDAAANSTKKSRDKPKKTRKPKTKKRNNQACQLLKSYNKKELNAMVLASNVVQLTVELILRHDCRKKKVGSQDVEEIKKMVEIAMKKMF
jgi:hypothetical protein